MAVRSHHWMCVCAASLLFAAGCGVSEKLETVPVTGTVNYKGKPVEGAQVSFMAKGASTAGIGLTDSDGRFKLTSVEKDDGAVLGQHTVTIMKVAGLGAETTGDQPLSAEEMEKEYDKSLGGSDGLTPAEMESELPGKYADALESGLTATVLADEEKNDFTFDLTD